MTGTTQQEAQHNDLQNVAAMMGATVEPNEPVEQLVEPVETAEDATAASEPEADFFENEAEIVGRPKTAPKGWTARVKIGPCTFFIIEASAQVLAAYDRENKAARDEIKAVDAQSKALDESKAEADETQLEALQERARKATDAMIEANTNLIEATVRDWENPKWPRKPVCNTQNRAQLSSSRKAELADLILQKTRTGRAASDRFLAS